MTLAIDNQPVRILLFLETREGGELFTWTPVMQRFEAEGCMRDWSHEEWYDGSPVGWDPCDVPGCREPSHVLRVKWSMAIDVNDPVPPMAMVRYSER